MLKEKELPGYPEPAGFISARDGGELAYYVYGSGPDIFILNGFSCNQHNLVHIVAALQDRYRLVTWDYKGHGRTPAPLNLDDVTIDGFLDDASRVMTHCRVKNPVFLGYSIGGQLMFEYQLRNPGTARALISLNGVNGRVLDSLLNTDLFGKVLPVFKKAVDTTPITSTFLFKTAMASPFMVRVALARALLIFSSKNDSDLIRPYIDSLGKLDPKLMIHFLNEMHNHTTIPNLNRITEPVLFIAGGKDNFIPLQVSRNAHQEIPHSRFEVIPDGYHISILDDPHETIRLIGEFLGDL